MVGLHDGYAEDKQNGNKQQLGVFCSLRAAERYTSPLHVVLSTISKGHFLCYCIKLYFGTQGGELNIELAWKKWQ